MNGHSGGSKDGGEVQLDIMEQLQRRRNDGYDSDGGSSGSGSYFEPRSEPAARGRGSNHGGPRQGGGYKTAERRITRFALQLAVLEKASDVLGKLAFVWATVVLLGGFASSLRLADFWSVTVILVSEGARVFSRGNELQWQRHSTRTSTAGGALRSSSRFCRCLLQAIVGRGSVPPGDLRVIAPNDALSAVQVVPYTEQRASHAPDETSPLPYTGWVFVSKNTGGLLKFHQPYLQVLSSLACVALSVTGLCKNDHGGDATDETTNQRIALVLFYSLALAEAALFLLEKAYWTWKVSCCNLLVQVSLECELGACGLVSLTRFFYDAYSQCISKSIFDGVKMDLVTFAKELIESDFLDEQLIGVRILRQFARSKSSAPETLRKVGTSTRSIERLVEMLNWKSPEEEEVRRCAAEVVSKLVGKSQNALRVAGIHGSIESVMSLLHTQRSAPTGPGPASRREVEEHEVSLSAVSYDYLGFNLVGLLILKKLARDHDNCGKIGNVRGLLSSVVKFTNASPAMLLSQTAADSQIRTVKRALQVLKMLVTTTGNTGKMLRREVADRVFTVSNLRGILQHGQQHRQLQKLAIDVLTGLAMDERAKEGIARTGSVVKLLLSLFLNASELSSGAGEALAMLALECKTNCGVILKKDGVPDRLITALDDKALRLNAARILRNLCAYAGDESSGRLRALTEAMPAVLQMTMRETESEKLLEASIGLTTQICRFLSGEQFAAELSKVGVDKTAYAERLAGILRRHTYPEIKVPRVRRFVVQQAIWLMQKHRDGYVELFRELDMEGLLESIADTTSDLECFHVFSGSVGLSQHRKGFSDIVESALELLGGRSRGGE